MTKRLSLIAAAMAYVLTVAADNAPTTLNLNQWQFSQDQQQWETVAVPHDWAISGPFDKKWDLQTVAIVQNGEEEATEKSGRSGSLPWIGEGWYTTTISLNEVPGYAELQIDGAMSEPRVYVNGSFAGYWPYGYNAFRLDITPLLHEGDNEIMIHLENVEESSRWYPGAGLYRPVNLRLANKQHINQWGTFVRTTALSDSQAIIAIDSEVVGATKKTKVVYEILDAEGNIVKSTTDNIVTLDNPKTWSPEQPYLYTLNVKMLDKKNVVDTQNLKFGVRTVAVSGERGFELNGQSRKIKGVCLHHDLGPLGAAVNKAALIRQVRILKDMGCDAIRTSHNMPSTMQMEVYDSLGMMVMAESFDMWIYPKCKNGYAKHFPEWAEKDITNLVLNHRNHPSCVMWSIGNEIPEQWDSTVGVYWATTLQDLCHELDPTRPVTQGLDQVHNALHSGFAKVMDVVGLNYRDHEYLNAYNLMPHGFILGSETASTVSSRGVYKDTELAANKTFFFFQLTAFDLEYCWRSNLPEVDFALQEDYPWTIGQFVWTGFDYLGEPTPYDEYWPSRSSYFGIMDLAGLPKDRFYLYRSVWNEDEHTVHLLPHWNWADGDSLTVHCYTDGESAELFVNGRSQGRVYKDHSKTIQDIQPDSVNVQPLLDRYRLRWQKVPYEAGELRVVAYDAEGNVIGAQVRRTAGEAKAIKFEADRTTLAADGNDLAYITLSLIDANGVELPMADDEIDIEVSGAGSFRAICNGDATSLEVFTEPHMKLFSGKLVVTVQAGTEPGTITVIARDKARNITNACCIAVK